ncbi:MAG: hypothetical protein Ct9H300mP32_2080 [Verrucomicrobiota bacterium]|nr:MAG: hypothetical protein Ct9H300mP32_2080 [Verrucomicrobiota bacterium]
MFVPAESLFSAALEGDPNLIVWAAERRITLATPTSLIALLSSVRVSWQYHSQSENARAIAEAAQQLYKRIGTFITHSTKFALAWTARTRRTMQPSAATKARSNQAASESTNCRLARPKVRNSPPSSRWLRCCAACLHRPRGETDQAK